MVDITIGELDLKDPPAAADEIEIQETSGGLSKKIVLNSIGGDLGGLTVLTGDKTYYVATTGSDSTGNGESGFPWQTIQYALNWISQNIHADGYQITIDLANGTYTEDVTSREVAGVSAANAVKLFGDTTTPANVTIRAALSWAVRAYGGPLQIAGVKLLASGENYDVLCLNNGMLRITGKCEFGASGVYIMYAGYGGTIVIEADIEISGGANVAFLLIIGTIAWTTGDITYTSSPTFSQYTVLNRAGLMYKGVGSYSGTHTATIQNGHTEHNGYTFGVNRISGDIDTNWTVATGGGDDA